MLPLQEFKNYIKQHALFMQKSKVLLAVSGGKDSVLMAHLFKQSGYNFGIAHCNFNLRGDEAKRDENFVIDLAKHLDAPLHIIHFETKKYANEHKISTQMAARDLRYAWFQEIRVKHKYDVIALAQHRNDAVETVLINLIRGTGISGLHGILPKRDNLIRPILFLSRADIDQYVDESKFGFVEDSSNASSNYTRNKLRLQVIPHLREINPNLEQTFAENMERFSEIELFLNQQVEILRNRICKKQSDGMYISIAEIENLSPKKLLLFELLKPFGFASVVVNEILKSLSSQSGTHFFSETHQALINRTDLIVSPKMEKQEGEIQFIHPETTEVKIFDKMIQIAFSHKIEFDKDINKAFIDADELIYPLKIRAWQVGDKFKPIGMQGYKKLSDFFIDKKIPLHLKNSIPIIENANGDIIWLAGLRQDNRYKITSNTKKVVIFELKSQ